MRVFKADISFAFHIHKMYLEYLSDTKQPIPKKIEKSLFLWVQRFSDPHFFVQLAMHGKKNVGMVWGHFRERKITEDESERSIHVEGIFLKRGFRGRVKGLRRLVDSLKETASQNHAIALSSVVPQNWSTKHKFRVSGVSVERGL